MRFFIILLVIHSVIAVFSVDGRGEVVLSASSDITIREEGDFDTAQGCLTELLDRNLKRALGKERLAGSGPPVEFLIRSEAARWPELPQGTIQELAQIDSFEIDIRQQPTPRVTITGMTPVAAGYGVMAFLENHLGIHWAFPGELGLCLPRQTPITLKDGTYGERPFAVSRALSGIVLRSESRNRRPAPDITGVLREERGFFLAEDYFKSLRLRGHSVSHAMIRIFPVERCLAEYPEVFPKYADGRPFVPEARRRGRGANKNAYQAWHPCYTEPKTLEVAIEQGRDAFDRGLLYYSLGINDGERFQCQCDACRRAGWPQSYYEFVTNVADALRTDYPAQQVGVLAYGDVGVPPDDLKLPENVLVNVAGQRKDLWEGRAPNLGCYEYLYGASFVIPNLPLEIIQENFRYYQQHNLQLYRAELYPVWAFDAPKVYIIRRLLWDPNRNVHALLREFCDRTFGAAGEAMYEYYQHAGSWRSGDVERGTWTATWGKVWPFRRPLQFERCPEDYHEQLCAALEDAEKTNLTDLERRRLEMVEVFTRFSATYRDIWRLKENVFSGAADVAALQKAQSLAASSESVLTEFSQHPAWFRGSSIGLESFRGRDWPLVDLSQQLRVAMATIRARGRGELGERAGPFRAQVALTPVRRAEHPRYKPWQSRRMKLLDRVAGGFRFESSANEIIGNHPDDRYNGKLRFQWLHARARGLDPAQRYLVRTEFEGSGGVVELELQGMLRGETRRRITLARSLLEFHDHAEKRRHAVVIDLSDFSELAPNQLATKDLNVQWILIWRPDSKTARLEGTTRVASLTES